jgi:hypothetical protein
MSAKKLIIGQDPPFLEVAESSGGLPGLPMASEILSERQIERLNTTRAPDNDNQPYEAWSSTAVLDIRGLHSENQVWTGNNFGVALMKAEYKAEIATDNKRHFHAVELCAYPPVRDSNFLNPIARAVLYNVAPTSLAYASVLKDLGRSIGAPRARSMMSWGKTPNALETPKRTV